MSIDPTRVPEAYGRTLTASAQNKLKALALLAEGGDDAVWRAVVLLHEARRAERRALMVLEAPSPETRLRSVVEQCGCLVDGRDPTALLDGAWGEVLEASAFVSPAVAAAIRRRLDPRVDALIREYASEMQNASDFFRSVEHDPPTQRGTRSRLAVQQAERLLRVFPGDSRLWQSFAVLRVELGDRDEAWKAVRRARELDPEDSFALGVELHLVPEMLPLDQARSVLDAAYAATMHGGSSFDVCFNLAVSLVVAAERAPDPRVWWEKALEVATTGLGLPQLDPREHKLCRVVQLCIRELLAARKPTVDILFRVGLGTLVPRLSAEEQKDLLRAVRTIGRARGMRMAA